MKKSLIKFKSKWMVEAWPHVQPFHGEGVVSAILVDSFIRKEKKSKTIEYWFLLVLGTSDRRRKETLKKQKKNKRRRTEKKEILEKRMSWSGFYKEEEGVWERNSY